MKYKEHRAFLICPVRNADEAIQNEISEIAKDWERRGFTVYIPSEDTDQKDSTGYRMCKDNREAISVADLILFYWDGKSQGCLFDLGMAFALGKKIYVVKVPAKTEGKSYQNMAIEWEKRQIENGRN